MFFKTGGTCSGTPAGGVGVRTGWAAWAISGFPPPGCPAPPGGTSPQESLTARQPTKKWHSCPGHGGRRVDRAHQSPRSSPTEFSAGGGLSPVTPVRPVPCSPLQPWGSPPRAAGSQAALVSHPRPHGRLHVPPGRCGRRARSARFLSCLLKLEFREKEGADLLSGAKTDLVLLSSGENRRQEGWGQGAGGRRPRASLCYFASKSASLVLSLFNKSQMQAVPPNHSRNSSQRK